MSLPVSDALSLLLDDTLWVTFMLTSVITAFERFSQLFFLSHVGIRAPGRKPATFTVGEKLWESGSVRAIIRTCLHTLTNFCCHSTNSGSNSRHILYIDGQSWDRPFDMYVLYFSLVCLTVQHTTLHYQWWQDNQTGSSECKSSSLIFSCFLSPYVSLLKEEVHIHFVFLVFRMALVFLSTMLPEKCLWLCGRSQQD